MEFKFVYFGWLVLLSLLLMPPSIYGQLRETEDENDGIVIDQPKANAVHVNERFSTNKKIFVPTDEWQEVEEGQGIPPGLHVRMNIATGKTEAKILDPNERTSQSTEQSAMVAVDKNDDEDDDSEVTVEDEDPMMIEDDEDEKSRLQRMTKAMEEAMAELKQGKKPATGTYQYLKEPAKEGIITDKKIFNRDEIREALKNFKVEKDEPKRDPEEIRKKFRPMEELKKDLEEMQLSIKTDLEILKQLLERYRNPGLQVDERVSILTDVEYHVHQIDNAQNFADMGGLDLVIKDLNNTEQEVRSEASFVIGSATQSNPRVKISAYESGALQQLVRMLPTETAVSVKNRVLYALSNLLRNFPLAQKVFLDQGGLEALHSLFGQQEAGGSTRLRVKVVTLLTDMITEKQHALDSGNEEKIRQYNDVSLRLSERGWCDDVTSLLGLPDHDTREKVLNAMAVLNQDCEFSSSTISETLHKLKEEYTKLADTEKQEDDGDDYFEGLLTSINDVLKTVSRQKDEL